MKKNNPVIQLILFLIFTVLTVLAQSGFSRETDPIRIPGQKPAIAKSRIHSLEIPVYFIQNQGQVDKRALFYARVPGLSIWITRQGIVFETLTTLPSSSRLKPNNGHVTPPLRDLSIMFFEGSDPDPEIIPLEILELKVNHIKGTDQSLWFGSLPTSAAVLYKNLYNNVDLKVYGAGRQLEYDWIIRPGGDPDDIKVQYRNVKGVKINRAGGLDVKTGFGTITHKKPRAYQYSNPVPDDRGKTEKIGVKTFYRKTGSRTFGFVTGAFNSSKPLIIDPVVLYYSTYVGTTHLEQFRGIAADSQGNAYLVGMSWGSDFPLLNQYQGDQVNADVIVVKIDTDQSGVSSLLYSTYLGGGGNDFGHDITVDNQGKIYITGQTAGPDFPTVNPLRIYSGNYDAFAAKLDPDQSGVSSLIWSTYMGGSDWEEGHGIAVDNLGSVYLAGITQSTDFPTYLGYQMAYGGNQDVFFVRFEYDDSGLCSYIYSTYLGGSEYEFGWDISVDGNLNAYLTGYTVSADFPVLNQYQDRQANVDAFITKFDTKQTGVSSLQYSTFLGGGDDDRAKDITANDLGIVSVAGTTESSDFPLLNPYQSYQGARDIFVTSLDTCSTGSPSLLYSTCLGGSGGDSTQGISADSHGYVYIIGSTSSPDFPVLNFYQGFQGAGDAVLAKFDTQRSGPPSLIFSSCLGGGDYDTGMGIAVDNSGYVYVAGFTVSSDFPLVNPYQAHQGLDDCFISKLALECTVDSSISGGDGLVSPATQTVLAGETVSISITPDPFYQIDTIIDNGEVQQTANPYLIHDIQGDHSLVISFKSLSHEIRAEVVGGMGEVFPEFQTVDRGDDAYISISPFRGYVIQSILDNGVSQSVVSQYGIRDVQSNHDIEVYFGLAGRLPTLSLSGERHIEQAWIIRKEYAQLSISITEPAENPAEIESYTLYKRINGLWTAIHRFNPGNQIHIDWEMVPGQPLYYKLTALRPDGLVAVETPVLEL